MLTNLMTQAFAMVGDRKISRKALDSHPSGHHGPGSPQYSPDQKWKFHEFGDLGQIMVVSKPYF